MKKRLLFAAVLTALLTVSSFAQSSGPNPESHRSTTACDLNLPLLFPSYNSQCAVEFSDLTVPVITDSCGNTVTPVTDVSVFPITNTGTTTIVWEFTNELGGIETANQNINILDFTIPVPDVAILPNFHSQCAVQAADLPVPTATDNCSVVTVSNNGVFPITASSLITWTYTDASGNVAYQDQDIYINDFTEPVPDVVILPNVHALCQINESDLTTPTATDNCGGLVTVTNNATFPILRSTLITWYYTDVNGNVSYQDQDIYIDDFDAPVADALSLSDFHALCQVDQTDLTVPTATDNCSVASVTNDGVFPILASTTITWTFADPSGNTAVQTQQIIIDDLTNPVPDAAVLADVVSECPLSATDLVPPTATDNCSIASITNDGVFPIAASTTLIWTFADHNGNSVTQSQNIIINDTTAPTPDVAVLSDVTAECQLLETDLIAPTATDNCSGIVTVSNDGIFPITASTMIIWTYTDANGNRVSQSQNIIIDDTTGPTPDVAVLADATAECELLEADLALPTATDNCSGMASITNNGTFPITASTTIIWTYTDGDGNTSSQTQNIVINDITAPTPDAAVLADVTAQCEILATDLTEPTATDNCSGVVTVTNDGVFPITASTTLNWTFADANGNTSTQTQNIVINDTVAPTPDAATLVDVTGECQVLEIDLTVPSATDNCSGMVNVSNDGIFPITASTTITWTFADTNGNTSSQTQNIIIDDTIAPTPDNSVLDDVEGLCQVIEADITAPTATDNCSAVTVTNDAVFPITASRIITWTFTDANGNASTQDQNIIISDAIAPTPDVVALADITAECRVLEADVVAPTATDNCSAVSVTHNTIFPITASTTITWTFTDANGNAATQDQNVIISDVTKPVADVAILADVTSQCAISETDLMAPTATDNCSAVTVTNDAVFPITASTTITWTYTDASGNSDSQTQNVIVNDDTAPTPDAAELTDIVVECELLDTQLMAPTATDNCSGTVTVSNDGIFPITASTTITWTFTDANGNSATQTQNVVIDDTTGPTPDAVTLVDVIGECQVLDTDLTVPSATDNCSGVASISNDGNFPITASTTITWTYTDGDGNISTQIQNIVINDTTAPTPDAVSLADVSGDCQVLDTDLTVPSATDNCSTVTVTHNAVFPISASTTITWTYTDASGNATTQDQNILINDNIAPTPDVVTLADVTAQCQVLEGDLVVPTATDNCSVASVTHNGVFPISASTTITWTYTDANGNSAQQEQNIIINDTTAPTPDAVVLADITAQCQVDITDITVPTATDNCSAVTVTNDAVFPITVQGVTTIIWTYTDTNGNSVNQTQDVLIGDNIAPTATLTPTSVSVDNTGNVSITAAQLENGTATDNCGLASITVFPNAFNCTELGDHEVTVTLVDVHGNVATQTTTVTVTDPSNFCEALGIDQNESVVLTLYPNPTSDQVYLQGTNLNVHSVSVYSVSGQLIQSETYQQTADRYGVSLKSLPQGIYFLKFQTNEATITQRVMKY